MLFVSVRNILLCRELPLSCTIFFNAGNKVVYIHDQPTSVEDIARTGSLQDRLGNKVVIWFTGGPPDERGWYEGTMLSMLLDYILRSALAEDHKRIEELCHILN